MEFFYFRSGEQVEPLDTAGYFDLTAHDLGSALRKQTVLRLEAMGIPVEYSFHENGPSQHEIDLRYTDALTMADNVMTFRLITKEVAADHGVLRDVHAEADRRRIRLRDAHARLAVRGRRERVPRSGRRVRPLEGREALHRGTARARRARSVAITNQWVNSYKRLIPGYEAPVYKCWARNNRSALVRVPLSKKGKNESSRIEFRAPDPGVQPVPRVLRHPGRRPEGHRRGLRALARSDRQHLRADRRRAARRRHHLVARLAARRARRDGTIGAGRRGARGARLRELPREQAAGVGRVQGVRHSVRDFPLSRYAVGLAVEGAFVNELLLVYPDPPPPLLAQTLDLVGHAVEVGRERRDCDAVRAGRRVDRRGGLRRRRSRRRVHAVPHAAQGRFARRVDPVADLGRAAQRPRTSRRSLRRLLPHAVPSQGVGSAAAASHVPCRARGLARRSRRTASWCSTSRRIRPRCTASHSTSRTWSTSCSSSS